MRPGRSYHRYVPFVGTSVFHWFLPTEGNISGPWQPFEGRPLWTGEPSFWIGQIKQIMMANIDAVYLHCINNFEPQRINFFRACNQLRREGWDIPKIAPFLDPFYLWREKPIDVSTRAGKDEFVRHYIRFFDQYFSENTDTLAASSLLHVDGKPVLTSWWVYSMLQNLEDLTREDVERRLTSALGTRMPSMRNGIYMMSTALIDPDYTFTDERMIMFSGYCYALHCVHKSIDVWHVQAGYWDQNIRQPGFFLPRDGGRHYRSAWDIVAFNMPYVHRVYVESWNEYDEGSGIFAADPAALHVNAAMHSNTDVYSADNDPFEYINATARGAARINGRAENDAIILGIEAPPSAVAGSEVDIRVTVRNDGNARWSGAAGYYLLTGTGRAIAIDDQNDEIPLYGGIFRGRPLTFKLRLPVGDVRGTFTTDVSMAKDGVPFGEKTPIKIEVC
jgi:hypothetical protein